jgi:ribosomal protein S18 acetylase RimI-like enzyme
MFDNYRLDAVRLSAELRRAAQRGEQLVGAILDGRPAGFVWFLKEGTFQVGGYVRLLVVTVGLTNAGVGSRLMDEAEERIFAARRDIFLLVNSENRRAQEFYRRRGYQWVGELKGFVIPGVDEYIFHKRRNG